MKKLMVIVAALTLIAGSAYAADWNFYGSARVSTFYVDTNNAQSQNTNAYEEALQSNARIGAHVKASDELSGRFEYGTSGDNANIRLLYGEWNFGAGSLTVGQDYTPIYMTISTQVYAGDAGLLGWGDSYPGRKAQLKVKFGDFQIALVETDTVYAAGTTASSIAGSGATEVQLPAIHARYRLARDNWFFLVAGGYQTFDVNLADKKSVDSYLVAASGGATFGPVDLKASGFFGTNVGNIISMDVSTSTTAAAIGGGGYASFDGTNLVDNDAYGYALVAAYTINDMFGLEAGFGYARTEYDGSGLTKDDVYSWYLQGPITLAPGVFIIPEMGMIDYEQSDQNLIKYLGAKWQINF
ncbi:MAG: porin [Desulfobacteraceae bacterium]|nr:porin [Desulfobacteraceae bacterium]